MQCWSPRRAVELTDGKGRHYPVIADNEGHLFFRPAPIACGVWAADTGECLDVTAATRLDFPPGPADIWQSATVCLQSPCRVTLFSLDRLVNPERGDRHMPRQPGCAPVGGRLRDDGVPTPLHVGRASGCRASALFGPRLRDVAGGDVDRDRLLGDGHGIRSGRRATPRRRRRPRSLRGRVHARGRGVPLRAMGRMTICQAAEVEDHGEGGKADCGLPRTPDERPAPNQGGGTAGSSEVY